MKKVVLFVTAIALVIAIAATGILAESRTTEPGNANAGRVDGTVETGEVDGTVEETESGDLIKTLPNENAERIDETVEPNEESNAINVKITPEAEEAPKQDEDNKVGEKGYTIGTLSDFGISTTLIEEDELFIPLSEYEGLSEELSYLADYDIYYPLALVTDRSSTEVNEHLQGLVDNIIFDITVNGAQEYSSSYNFTLHEFLAEELFPAVYDHLGYGK